MSAARAPLYPIRAVARMTGLSIDTLRAWERRYQVVTPIRKDRGRFYSDAHVTRLRQLAALVASGHAIGTVAGLTDTAIARLIAVAGLGAPAAAHAGAVDLAPLVHAMRRFELEAVDAQLNRHAVMLPPADFVFAVVLPALRDIGDRWKAGTVRPSQEHLVSAVLRSVLGGLLRTMPKRAGGVRIMFATLPGERHELGLLSAAVLAASAGASAVYLGPDLPVDDIVHAAAVGAADVLVLAATTPPTVDHAELRKLARLKRVDVWVGGAHATALAAQLGPGATAIARLEDLAGHLDRRVN
jgi:MerR family transcriptional regulator, light-induced transcriptional regulator